MLLKKVRYWSLWGFLQAWKTNHFTDGFRLLQIKLSSSLSNYLTLKNLDTMHLWRLPNIFFGQTRSTFSWTAFCPPFHNTYTHDPYGHKDTSLLMLRSQAHGFQWCKIRHYETITLKNSYLFILLSPQQIKHWFCKATALYLQIQPFTQKLVFYS